METICRDACSGHDVARVRGKSSLGSRGSDRGVGEGGKEGGEGKEGETDRGNEV